MTETKTLTREEAKLMLIEDEIALISDMTSKDIFWSWVVPYAIDGFYGMSAEEKEKAWDSWIEEFIDRQNDDEESDIIYVVRED